MAVKDIFDGNSWISGQRIFAIAGIMRCGITRPTILKKSAFMYGFSICFLHSGRNLKNMPMIKGLKIIGDIPIYVAYDSADVWAHPEMFQLDQERKPAAVAGCPPDGFSADGQLWGNPLYRWDHHRNTGYDWWVTRISWCFDCMTLSESTISEALMNISPSLQRTKPR